MFPTPYTVQRIRRTKSGENSLGQPTYTATQTSVKVHAIEPASEIERYTAALAGRTVTDLKLLSPTGDFLPQDAVVIDGVTYEVDGQVQDMTKGPFVPGFGGYVIGLRRVSNG